ncbi:MAG: sigma-70 family RNA polymerase sigma factor [Myxococcales bacterium]|nr:sigma-70 family RNA polymerase sigma factor [Myxococcales bacterium]
MQNQLTQQQITLLAQEQWPKLKRFFKAKVPEPDCYDLTQDTLLAFVRADPAQLRDPKAYLWGIARKRLLAYCARKRPSETFESTRMSMADIGGFSTVLDRRRRLLGALQRLPLDQQVAFELRHCEELSLQEVADAMELSLATIKRYLQAATASLRDILATREYADESADHAAIVDVYRKG